MAFLHWKNQLPINYLNMNFWCILEDKTIGFKAKTTSTEIPSTTAEISTEPYTTKRIHIETTELAPNQEDDDEISTNWSLYIIIFGGVVSITGVSAHHFYQYKKKQNQIVPIYKEYGLVYRGNY